MSEWVKEWVGGHGGQGWLKWIERVNGADLVAYPCRRFEESHAASMASFLCQVQRGLAVLPAMDAWEGDGEGEA